MILKASQIKQVYGNIPHTSVNSVLKMY